MVLAGQTETYCTVLVSYDKQVNGNQIQEALEGGSSKDKREAMKKCVYMMLNGEDMSQLFMTIVRYVLPSEDHTIQKLLLLYLEQLQKKDSDGKLLPEMILICQNLRNNLQHPNEYLRGVTLRFLCRIKELEILEPLIPSILSNLEHRHSFVRRSAAMCVKAIYDLFGDQLLPDASEMILENFLANEQDVSARRNALLMLCTTAPDLAVQYLMSQLDQLPTWPDILQLVVLDLVRSVCRTQPENKGKYIKLILALMSSKHTSVAYECANTLIQLSRASSAIRAAAMCYCQLLINHSDNNVKLIVLGKLEEMKAQHGDILKDMVMDILRALSSPNVDIKKKILDIVLDLLSSKNIEEVVLALKKEVVKVDDLSESAGEHRQMLVQAIHKCTVNFPDVAGAVVPLLMGFLTDSNTVSAVDVIYFVREIMETNPKLQQQVLELLLDVFPQIRTSRVCSCSLWILGEYSNTAEEVMTALEAIKECVGPLPFFHTDEEDGSVKVDMAESVTSVGGGSSSGPKILADGSYATESAVTMSAATSFMSSPNLRALILACDYFLASIVASTYTKLVIKLMNLGSAGQVNKETAESMLYIASLLRLSESGAVSHSMDLDSKDKINVCLNILTNPSEASLLEECRNSFAAMIEEKHREEEEDKKKNAAPVVQPDDLIDFYHLKNTQGMSQIEMEDAVATDLSRAMGVNTGSEENGGEEKVVQLTGFSDPVYAEAFMTVHQYDIVLDIYVANRHDETLQDVSLELATMGDLKLVERPSPVTLGVGESAMLRANIKVSSTETGVIFGSLVTGDIVIVLNDIHLDIADYLHKKSELSDASFRSRWAEFEWENKVAINTTIADPGAFLDKIIKSTSLQLLTPDPSLEGNCGYLAANLFTRSVFGEDALVNISVEKNAEGELVGYVRIRSKTQGIALSLGDKITLKQKSLTA
ncbi:subunit beta of coatomer [Chloropicon primus]|uniref:Coatomer subunit beta n=1 Tax=Chloropicon primus TaxID=1764295 RepID=A0A5B8MY23_9CHLO|nr:subunit beta of coatomer [Chloropicon primus]UPR04679.1 subunit beta of coatomer [Chloropicon primus]|mmetsp:Transcript_3100/g.8468  ORF Transcript_3100/g.8468 Transcript_3100/m.8468 type:complete len:936 (+) Transcript_3100:226-3033(+)|eukprot:QDZ25483.1 subunit beta of coatomer [Chloropicon primus]